MPDTITVDTVIPLPLGWKLTFDVREESQTLQGFVESPAGRNSASLEYARMTGFTSDDAEKQIPTPVMAALDKYEEYE
jgi:hypothetical protein